MLSQDVPSELTDQQLATLNSLNQQFLGQQQQIGNLLLPQFQSILNNPGLSPAEKAAVTGQIAGRARQRLRALQQSAQNPLARTLGIPAELLNVRNNASRNSGGFFSSFGSGLGSTLAALPGAFL